jgi:hypothetical protein
VQLGMHVFMVPDVRAMMGLQDVRAGYAVNAYKTCRHAATMLGDVTGWSHATDRAQRGRRQERAYPMPMKTSFTTPSH